MLQERRHVVELCSRGNWSYAAGVIGLFNKDEHSPSKTLKNGAKS